MSAGKQSEESRTAYRREVMACTVHPERVAMIRVGETRKCRECYMGDKVFERWCRRHGITAEQYWARMQNQIDLFGPKSHG